MTFDLQPHLKGDLVELRPLTPDDFDALYQAAKDPLIWEQHAAPNRYKPDVFRRYFDVVIASGGAFVIRERATGRVIGFTRFCNLRTEESQVEIGGTFLERASWGGGYNREMKSLMLGHALRFVERVVLVVAERNLRSRKAVENIGGRFLRRSESEPGRPPVPMITYAIMRSERTRS